MEAFASAVVTVSVSLFLLGCLGSVAVVIATGVYYASDYGLVMNRPSSLLPWIPDPET